VPRVGTYDRPALDEPSLKMSPATMGPQAGRHAAGLIAFLALDCGASAPRRDVPRGAHVHAGRAIFAPRGMKPAERD
jgi:hypothetical protein